MTKSRNKIFRRSDGFSLVEIIFYSAILSVVILVLSELLLFNIRNYRLAKIKDDLITSGAQALSAFSQEVKNAKKIYLPTSVFDSDFGELSLTTAFQPIDNTEPVTYVDIYWAGGQLWLKRENETPQALTRGNLEVSRFKLVRVSSDAGFEGVRLFLDLKSKIKPNENIALTTFVLLRGGYMQ